jgi:hypothetical protein
MKRFKVFYRMASDVSRGLSPPDLQVVELWGFVGISSSGTSPMGPPWIASSQDNPDG